MNPLRNTPTESKPDANPIGIAQRRKRGGVWSLRRAFFPALPTEPELARTSRVCQTRSHAAAPPKPSQL